MDATALTALGDQAIDLLYAEDFDTLARRFGYALAHGREPAAAIQEDLRFCLAEAQATRLKSSPEHFESVVKYFGPNDTGLIAVVECFAGADNGSMLLVELIVTGRDAERHVTLEQISAVRT